MEVTFLGGADEIGASCAVLDLEGTRLVVDCGQRMNAPPGQALPDFSHLEQGPPVDAVLLTHAHADHIGALPALIPFLPADCPILGTEPTLAVSKVMLEDSIRIMAQHRAGDGELPLFPAATVQQAIHRFKEVRWGKATRVGEAWATWFPSGHILGAGMIEVHAGGDSVLFSGDLSVADQLSVPGVFVPAIRPRVLILESTYGNRLHAHRPAQEQRIVDRVADCLAAGGHVLFPTFALGRAQEVLLLLGRAMREKKLPPAPVFADGLVRAIARVYARHPDELTPACRRLWEQGLDPIFPHDLPIHPVRSNDQRERIAAGEPCVVVSSSGMLQGGASQFYARQWLDDPRNLILVTGYQDEESPGQALLNLAELPPDQPRFFKLGGVRTEVRCQVESCQLSAHADNGELVSVASKLQPSVIFLVHGDSGARAYLANSLMAVCHAEVMLPSNGETHHLLLGSTSRQHPSARPNPLALWPPWDPQEPRELDLARFHQWLTSLSPRVSWVTIDELVELWRSPAEPNADDRLRLREAVYQGSQPYFLPDARRPYILKVNAPENLRLASVSSQRAQSEQGGRILRELFPEGSGLRRFGFYPEEGLVRMEFQFPRSARRNLLGRLGEFRERSGWEVELSDRTEDSDLIELVEQFFSAAAVSSLDIDHAAAQVRLSLDAASSPEDIEDLSDRFQRTTGYALDVSLVEAGVSKPRGVTHD